MAADLTEANNAEVKLTFFYCMFSFWSTGVLVLVCVLSEGVAAFGSVLHSPHFLLVGTAYEIGKVFLAKLLSGHASSLRLPWWPEHDNKPIRGPVLRKVYVKLTRGVQKLTPVYHLCHGLLILLGVWATLVFFIVCLGASARSEWCETGSFALLLLLLTVFPILLTKGPSLDSLRDVFTGEKSTLVLPSFSCQTSPALNSALYYNTLLSLGGAWLGAWPIPLDWDRPWQVWPISCCLGAVAGHIVANVIGAGLVWRQVAAMSTNTSANKRKFT